MAGGIAIVSAQDLRLCPLNPQFWGEQDLTPPELGGSGGLIGRYCVSPDLNLCSKDINSVLSRQGNRDRSPYR
jgi:hypothetical protein